MEARRVALAAAVLLGAGAAGCKHGEPAAGGTGSPSVTTTEKAPDDELSRMLRPAPGPLSPSGAAPPPANVGAVEDKPIQVTGVARDAAMGAVVIDDAGATWYVEGLERWEAALQGKRVAVSGIVRERKLAPDPHVGPSGEVSHGMVGTSRVITRPSWKRAD